MVDRRGVCSRRAEIIQLKVLLAYEIDFPEEDDGPISPERIQNALTLVRESLEKLLATAPMTAMVRDGALVTKIPPTTRDAIEASLDTPGLPLRLVDTAGLRETPDVVERLGIEVSEKYLAQAQLVLVCAEDVAGLNATVERITPLAKASVVAVSAVSAESGAGLGALIGAMVGRL